MAAGSRRWPGRAPRSWSATRPAGWATTDRRSRRSNQPARRPRRSRSRSMRPVSAWSIAWADNEGRRHPRHPRCPSRLASRRPTRDRPSPRRRRRLVALAAGLARSRRRASSARRQLSQEPRIAPPDGAGEGGAEHRSERTSRCVSEERRAPTRARAVPRCAVSGSQAETGSAAAKIETCASSGSITPNTFWRVRRWTHDPQLSK